MMTDENVKISLFPRVRRPAVRAPHREDPQKKAGVFRLRLCVCIYAEFYVIRPRE